PSHRMVKALVVCLLPGFLGSLVGVLAVTPGLPALAFDLVLLALQLGRSVTGGLAGSFLHLSLGLVPLARGLVASSSCHACLPSWLETGLLGLTRTARVRTRERDGSIR